MFRPFSFKSLIFFIFLVLSSNNLSSEVLIVSDIDDTIKISNVKNRWNLVWNYIIGAKPFEHLAQIFREAKNYYQKRDEKVSFFYLSASLQIFDAEIWLKRFKIPMGDIRQKSIGEAFTLNSKDYKYFALENYFEKKVTLSQEKNEELEVILIGDNGEYDPHVYLKFYNMREKFGLKDVKIFVRKVNAEKEDLPVVNYFLSEKELVEFSPFKEIVSQDTKNQIAFEYQKGTLMPDFIKLEFQHNN